MNKDPKKPPPNDEEWQPSIPRRQASLVFGGMLLVMLLAALDQTIVSTALPRIVADLHGLEYYSWVAAIYMLASTCTVPIYGKLSDIFGRKYILLFGIVVFLAGSAWCGAAGSMLELVAARALQGFGAGALIPVAFATLAHLYSPREIGKYQGLIAGVFVLASVIGPPVGGWITDHTSWRWVFYVNLPVGALAAVVLMVLMPRFASDKERVKIDFLGAALLMAGLICVLLCLHGAGASFGVNGSLWLGLGGGVLLLTFLWHQFHTDEPIMDPHLFAGNPVVRVASLITMLTGATMISSVYFMPLFLQVVLDFSSTQSGNMMLPLSIATGIGSVVSGYYASKTGSYRRNAICGALILNVGLLLIVLNVGPQATAIGVLIATSCAGLGLGVAVSLYGVVVRNAVPLAQMGQASAGLTLFRQLGGTLGMAVGGTLMNAQVSGATIASLDAATKAAFAAGVHHVYLGILGLSVLSTILVFFLQEIPLREAGNKKE